MKRLLKISTFLFAVASISCQTNTQKVTARIPIGKANENIVSKDSANLDLISNLGKRDLYEHAKWTMYCLYCDSLVRFKEVGGQLDTITYGYLQLKLDSLFVSKDTISFMFRFIYCDKAIDTNLVYSDNFPWWNIRYTESTIKSMQLFISGNKDLVRYFKPENPFDTQLKYSLPNVVEYINQNKDHIDPWFRIEAEKRHLIN